MYRSYQNTFIDFPQSVFHLRVNCDERWNVDSLWYAWNKKSMKTVNAFEFAEQTEKNQKNKFVEPWTTINAAVCCDISRRVRRATQNKRRGLLSSGIVLIGHDNAHLQNAEVTQNFQFNWEVFDHPPYSTDLAPNVFHLFPECQNGKNGLEDGA